MSNEMIGNSIKFPNVSVCKGRSVNFVDEICILLVVLFQKAGLNPGFVSCHVYDLREAWKFSFPQGVQIGSAYNESNKLDLTIIIPKRPHTLMNVFYKPENEVMWSASTLREHIRSAIGGRTRFQIDNRQVKIIKHALRSTQVLPEMEKHQPDEIVLVAPEEIVEEENLSHPPHGESTGRNDEVVSLKDLKCLESVILELATNSTTTKGQVFSFDDLTHAIETALNHPMSIGQMRGITNSLVWKGYIEKIGSAPSRYETTKTLHDHVNDGIPTTEKKSRVYTKRDDSDVGTVNNGDPFTQKVQILRREVANKLEAQKQLSQCKVERQAILDAISKKKSIPHEVSSLSRQIGELNAKLAKLTQDLEAVQAQQTLAEKAEDELKSLTTLIERLQLQSSGLEEHQTRLSRAESALEMLRIALD